MSDKWDVAWRVAILLSLFAFGVWAAVSTWSQVLRLEYSRGKVAGLERCSELIEELE